MPGVQCTVSVQSSSWADRAESAGGAPRNMDCFQTNALHLTPFVIAHFVFSFVLSFGLHSHTKSCPVSCVEIGNEFDSWYSDGSWATAQEESGKGLLEMSWPQDPLRLDDSGTAML